MNQNFDLRPGCIVRDLNLKRPVMKKTACYGHFGREDADFTWEVQMVEAVYLSMKRAPLGPYHPLNASTLIRRRRRSFLFLDSAGRHSAFRTTEARDLRWSFHCFRSPGEGPLLAFFRVNQNGALIARVVGESPRPSRSHTSARTAFSFSNPPLLNR